MSSSVPGQVVETNTFGVPIWDASFRGEMMDYLDAGEVLFVVSRLPEWILGSFVITHASVGFVNSCWLKDV